MDDEIWKDIPGYEEKLQASNLGQIRAKAFTYKTRSIVQPTQRRPARPCKQHLSTSGYRIVHFRVNSRRVMLYVHRLIALTFCCGYRDDLHVDHINADKHDNRATNLQWITPSENTKKMWYDLGPNFRRGETHPDAKLAYQDVAYIRHLLANGFKQKCLAVAWGVQQPHISAINTGAARTEVKAFKYP